MKLWMTCPQLKNFYQKDKSLKAKILSIDDEGKLNLSLKDNDYFMNKKKSSQY